MEVEHLVSLASYRRCTERIAAARPTFRKILRRHSGAAGTPYPVRQKTDFSPGKDRSPAFLIQQFDEIPLEAIRGAELRDTISKRVRLACCRKQVTDFV